MRVLVCGGRDYADREAMFFELYGLTERHGWLTVIEGGDGHGRPKIRGADSLAREWAVLCRHKVVTVRAEWSTHGSAAGPIRNERMLRDHRPGLVLAFPSPVRGLKDPRTGRVTGTGDMVQRARDAGVEVRVIGDNQQTEGLGLC